MDEPDRFSRQAEGWTSHQYADSGRYLARRAEVVERLGPPLERGALVLDLACGDGGLGLVLLQRGFRYRGVDLEPGMVEAAQRLLAGRAEVEIGDLDTYVPPEDVDATAIFRAVYYSRDRRALFSRIRSFTRMKVVLDVNPRADPRTNPLAKMLAHPLAGIVADLEATGWTHVVVRPFFTPQSARLPRPAAAMLRALERTGPLARLVLRYRFTYLVSASAARR